MTLMTDEALLSPTKILVFPGLDATSGLLAATSSLVLHPALHSEQGADEPAESAAVLTVRRLCWRFLSITTQTLGPVSHPCVCAPGAATW